MDRWWNIGNVRRCGESCTGQIRGAATYLLHLVERRLVNAELLKVILRGLDHFLNDLLVDIALQSRSACRPWAHRQQRAYTAPGDY